MALLITKFNELIETKIKPKGDQTKPEDDETISAEEYRQLAIMRKESMRTELLFEGYGGIKRDKSGRV